MANHRWLVGLEGHQFDVEALAEFLGTSGSIKITRRKDDGQWYLCGPIFDDLDTSASVKDRAAEVVELLNGAGLLFNINNINHSSTVSEITESGVRKHTFLVADGLKLRVRVQAAVIGSDGKHKENPNILVFRRIVTLAQTDPRVRDALHFLSQPQTWNNLYKVFEVIHDDIKRQVYHLVDTGKLRAFTATAQSRRLLGDAARHASEQYSGPRNPISLAEARHLIRQLVENWLNQYQT